MLQILFGQQKIKIFWYDLLFKGLKDSHLQKNLGISSHVSLVASIFYEAKTQT